MSAWVDLASFHLLRPHWLWALAALPLLLVWARRRQRDRGAWQGLVDPHLLPHLLDPRRTPGRRAGPWLAVTGYALAVLALAGPSWRQSPQPLWQSRSPLVIALDLSSASLAADLPPSRLAQARAKLGTLLRARTGGEVGLVVFADDAFTVAPLTHDAANVALFLDALQPEVMPVDGQRVERAIAWSAALLERTGARTGDILVLTDRADDAAHDAARRAAASGFRVSVLGLGTGDGAAYRRRDGVLAQARLAEDTLQRLAANGGGRYARMDLAGGDLRALHLLDAGQGAGAGGGTVSAWLDEGYWLLPPLLLLALFAFRRQHGMLVLLVACLAWPARDVQAQGWWRRPDQAAHHRVEQGNAAYRRGDYAQAAERFATADSADAHYNRGNALAQAGRYAEALAAYDAALQRQPRMEDALANRAAVEAAMKRQPPAGGQGEGQRPTGEGGGQTASGEKGTQAERPSQASSQNDQATESKSTSGKNAPPGTPEPAEPPPGDAERQREADRAQRERMQRALQQARAKAGTGSAQSPSSETPGQRERRVANEAWLRRIPDDPGGLLRAKFRLEHERRQSQGRSQE